MDYLQTKGRIFDIQRFSIHDGTGIRTIVFFKGCAFRCRWCCNPESQSFDIETMMVKGKPKIIGKDVTVEQVLEILEKDRPYYRRSGGGLTLSGGEILCQPQFAKDLLYGAKKEGISTAIESTGYASYGVIQTILPYVDQFLMDIKHTNSQKHKDYTGKENDKVLENARSIAISNQTELIIRVPVVSGFNDRPEEIRDIALFANSLPSVKQIHILPYHRLGQDKYEGLGRTYTMNDILPPSYEYMAMLKNTIEQSTSLACQIGG